MDPAAIRELIALESSQFDASFEYWLGASFAVVVAVHAARDSMLRIHRYTLTGVYVLFCVGTIAKAVADLAEIGALDELIKNTPLGVDTLTNRLAAGARMTIYVVFSSLVTAFVLLPSLWAGGQSDE